MKERREEFLIGVELELELSHADKGTKGIVQCLANAMASVCALPVKCHEPAVMALAGSVIVRFIVRAARQLCH